MLVRAVANDPTLRPAGAEIFESFFAKNYEPVLRAVYLVTGDRGEAEDLAQESFVKAYERWDRIRKMDNPSGYVYRMAFNAYRSRLRRLGVAARRSVSPMEPDPISESDDRDAIRRALATLPDPEREVIVLIEWLGMTSEEAGTVLGVSPGAVRVRLTRAKQAFRLMNEGASP
jgi:RNA polymerase sigma-70 factor (ECF subfamily)